MARYKLKTAYYFESIGDIYIVSFTATDLDLIQILFTVLLIICRMNHVLIYWAVTQTSLSSEICTYVGTISCCLTS